MTEENIDTKKLQDEITLCIREALTMDVDPVGMANDILAMPLSALGVDSISNRNSAAAAEIKPQLIKVLKSNRLGLTAKLVKALVRIIRPVVAMLVAVAPAGKDSLTKALTPADAYLRKEHQKAGERKVVAALDVISQKLVPSKKVRGEVSRGL